MLGAGRKCWGRTGSSGVGQEVSDFDLKCALFRYNEAKELAKNLEKQAVKVQAEAEEAGNRAMKIYANLTGLPSFDTAALEVGPRRP